MSRSTSLRHRDEAGSRLQPAARRTGDQGEHAALLFLGASVSQLPSIRHARRAGFRVVAVDADPDAPGFAFVDAAEQVDFSDVARVVEVGARHKVAGVLAISSDRAVAPAAQVASELGLPGIGDEVARAMTNKGVMRRRLELAGVPQPPYRILTRDTDVEETAAGLGFPCVLKPADSGGQRGLFRIGEIDEVTERLPEVLAVSRSREAILEEYMPGTELNGLVVVRDGDPTLLTLSDRLRPDGVAFGVGWIHSFPSALPERALASARAVAFAAVRALGLRDGIAFPQLIVDEHGAARIVEIAARIPAGQMADLALLGTGINLFDIAIAQALGRPVATEMITARSVRPIAIRFLTASPGVLPVGQVTRIAGLNAVRASPGVLTADVYFAVDDVISPLRVDFDRRGYVVATGDSATTALERADTAAAKLIVHTRDPGHALEVGMIGIRHLARLAPVATVLILLVVGLFANDLARHASVPARLVAAIRLDRRFSPGCGCSRDVAHIAVNLLGHARVTVRMLDSLGQSVATLTQRAPLTAGWNHLRWTGRNSRGELLHAGPYRPEFVFTGPRQQVVIAGPIELEANHPTHGTDKPAASSSSADSAPRLALARPI